MIKKYIDTFKKYFSLKADHPFYLFAMFVTAIIRSGFLLTFPYFAAKIIEYASLGLFDIAFLYTGIYACIYFMYVVSYHANYMAHALNANYIQLKLQEKVIDKIASYDEEAFKKISKSYLINTTVSDIATVKFTADQLIEVMIRFIALIIAIVILMNCNFVIGMMALLLNYLYIKLYHYHNEQRDIYLKRQKQSQDKITDYFNQIIDGNKEIRSFDMEEHLNKRFRFLLREWGINYIKKRHYHDRKETILSSILRMGRYLSYVILILGIAYGDVTIATLVLIIGYYTRIENGNKDFRVKLNDISQDSVKLNRVYHLLNYTNTRQLTFGSYAVEEMFGNIEFEHVSFHYNEQSTLKDISFCIESNSLVAVVGKSGSGKSTIFKLLLRLYQSDKGNIYIDGVNILEYSKDTYPQYVSIATQRPFIFNMSIKENLDLVNTNVTKQMEACKRVGIHDFIMNLPRKYNTILKEDAIDVSGGQKQLISLARTLLAESSILLLDEVTSSLDPNTSKHITSLLKELKKDHTIVIITHTPSQMRKADKIIVVDKGSIVGVGTHKELMKDNKYYQNLQK